MTPLNLAAIEKAAKEATRKRFAELENVDWPRDDKVDEAIRVYLKEFRNVAGESGAYERLSKLTRSQFYRAAEVGSFAIDAVLADIHEIANPATILALCERIRAPVKVKPLEWQERNEHWTAECVIGDGYSIDFAPDDEMELTPWSCWAPDGSLGHFRDLDDAKRACQADYDSRIRSALITETDNG